MDFPLLRSFSRLMFFFQNQASEMSIAMITTFPMVIGDWNKRIRRARFDISGGRSKNRRKESVSFLNCPTRVGRASVVGKFFSKSNSKKNDKTCSFLFLGWHFQND